MNSETLELKRKRDALHSLWRQLESKARQANEQVDVACREYSEADRLYWNAFHSEPNPTFKEKERTEK